MLLHAFIIKPNSSVIRKIILTVPHRKHDSFHHAPTYVSKFIIFANSSPLTANALSFIDLIYPNSNHIPHSSTTKNITIESHPNYIYRISLNYAISYQFSPIKNFLSQIQTIESVIKIQVYQPRYPVSFYISLLTNDEIHQNQLS